jgi:molecular chaperone HscB
MTLPLCWSCYSPPQQGTGEPACFCAVCGAVQPPAPETSLFAALALPEAFLLDRAALEQSYLAAQRQLHPDRLQDRSAREQLFAGQQAMLLNEAYGVLRDPLRRGRYLLGRLGYPVPQGETTVQDPEILMESLDQREALAKATTDAELAALAAATATVQQQCEDRIAAAFATQDLPEAAREVLRLGYLCRFAEAIRDRQRQALRL